jgi:hypothetical protein
MLALLLTALFAGVLAIPAASATVVTPPAAGAIAPADDNPNDPNSPNYIYNKDNIKVDLHRAPLPYSVAENYVTMDIVVTKKDGTPPTANYGVFLTFNELGKDAQETPAN